MARSRARLGGRRVGERGAADARHVGARHLTKLLLQQRVAHANAQLPHRAGPGRRQPQHMNTIGDFSLAALPHGRTATSQWAFGSQLPGASGPRRSGAAGAELQGRRRPARTARRFPRATAPVDQATRVDDCVLEARGDQVALGLTRGGRGA